MEEFMLNSYMNKIQQKLEINKKIIKEN
jgi:hypothetical protein